MKAAGRVLLHMRLALSALDWTVLPATLAYYMLGALWFTPLFGAAWDRALGYARPERQAFNWLYYAGPLAGCLVMTTATALLISALGVTAVADAAALGALVGLGYGGAVSVTNAIMPIVPRPLLLGAVTGGYHVVGNVISAIVLALLS